MVKNWFLHNSSWDTYSTYFILEKNNFAKILPK
jgi:hypothetical protein